jgi:phospholipase C
LRAGYPSHNLRGQVAKSPRKTHERRLDEKGYRQSSTEELVMMLRSALVSIPLALFIAGCAGSPAGDDSDGEVGRVAAALSEADRGDDSIHRVKHVIVIMQENHSFDNYFGALAFAPNSPYHSPRREDGCGEDDHRCVDGLDCRADHAGNLHCGNANLDDDGSFVKAFHDPRRCVAPDLDHSWVGTHHEANFRDPNDALSRTRNDGFVLVNDVTEQPDTGGEAPNEDQTMAFYTQDELPFYYDLAESFAISDRYFCSVLGPTFPNRSYLLAATSFGHLTTSDDFPPPGGYKPITGTIFDLLEANGVSWADYFQDAPQGGSFREFSATAIDPHFFPLPVFLAQVAGAPGAPPLPAVSFVDPNFGLFGIKNENDEHPPTDIQRGQAFVSQVLRAVRSGPLWKDSVIFFTYDEHGGFHDHVAPPRAPQGHARTPDGISPGQCADLSNPPSSLAPGGGAECATNLLDPADSSVHNATTLCPALAANPTGPFPRECASFDQLGFRVPFVAISPFSKPHYVSHEVGDHTSILAFIEHAFLSADREHETPHLTKRDEHANRLEDLFDFDRSPSLDTPIGAALPPAVDCTPQ